jgi:hypothetical protein
LHVLEEVMDYHAVGLSDRAGGSESAAARAKMSLWSDMAMPLRRKTCFSARRLQMNFLT